MASEGNAVWYPGGLRWTSDGRRTRSAAHLDGCESRRLRRDAPAWQAGRDSGALVQRAESDGGDGRQIRGCRESRQIQRSGDEGEAYIQYSLLERRTRMSLRRGERQRA